MTKNGRTRKPDRPYVRQPDSETPTVEHSVAEGVLIARSALTMEVKNRIIVSTLRDGQLFDPEVTAGFVVHELADLADEQADYADRMDSTAAEAAGFHGRATHQHDYHSLDLPSLIRRAEIYRSLSAELVRLRDDRGFVDALVESARADAWSELGSAIALRLESERGFPVDPDYQRDRHERLATFLALDFAALTPKTERRNRVRGSGG